ncbi:hypothetical protein [[Mycobacterium] crassicus]|uniref:Dihydrodiol dehydrogenase n=1 Tax=[Mycobacterium] crassicus TaxID=2872309 RepID=A0ABU5XS74_9MYCO|nr:hypothetical protein [Mycolicibacter sp. MYC098]MEB3023921.1 hypothetical protein [Mycolicibacter sp. MYC098]
MSESATVTGSDGVGRYDSVSASRFDVVIDPDSPRIGIRVQPHEGLPYVLPVEHQHAKWLAEDIITTVYARAPELFDNGVVTAL